MASLKRFDLFPKLNAESRRTTAEGGLISLIGVIIGLILIINETIRASSVRTLERLELFQETQANLTIYVEVKFFHIKCDELIFDVSTSAESESERKSAGWTIQELRKHPLHEDKHSCKVKAAVDVARYQSGEMHVSLNPHMLPDGQFGFTVNEYFKYNASHEITSVSIGQTGIELDVLPIQTFSKKIVPRGGTGRYLYEFNVVPQLTTNSRSGKKAITFPTQCRERDIITHNDNEAIYALQQLGLPGVFMTFQLSTLMVVKVETKPSWSEYFIHLLGIVAGTSAMVALVDSFLHETLWKSKLD